MSHPFVPLGQFQRYSINIEGIVYLIPSDGMILEVLSLIPESNWDNVLTKSNDFVSTLNAVVDNPDCQQQLFIWYVICISIGFSFNTFFKAYAESGWYSILDSGGIGADRRYRQLCQFEKISEAVLINGYIPTKEQIDLQNAVVCHKPDKLTRFRHYESAWNVIECVLKIAVNHASHDRRIRLLLLRLITLQRATARQICLSQLFTQLGWSFCNFCGHLFDSPKGPGRGNQPHCGSLECKKEYERVRKPNSKPYGWVKAHKPSPCANCGEKLVLNADLLCEKCFGESLVNQ